MPGEKTEKATPKRKQDERKKGNIFFSQEIVIVFTLLATFYVLKMMLPSAVETLQAGIRQYTGLAAQVDELTYEGVQSCFMDALIMFAKTALIPLLVCCLVASLATLLQTRMMFSTKGFSFKGERINPLQGLKKMFTMRAFVELMKSILKITILLYVIYSIFKGELTTIPRMMDMTLQGSMAKTGAIIMEIVVKAGAIFVFLAAADYLFQWWQYEKNLRMTKQEIKDEYKQTEGDPQIKSRIRAIQQQRARQRMIQNVPTADVVIRNPTHFAVAVKYDALLSRAPIVVAKGVDSLALRIVEVAQENGVYVTENKPLARALYESVELDQEIPEKFYRAIAEVLAFVYSLRKKELK